MDEHDWEKGTGDANVPDASALRKNWWTCRRCGLMRAGDSDAPPAPSVLLPDLNKCGLISRKPQKLDLIIGLVKP